MFSLAVIGSIVGILAVTGRRVAAYAVTTAVGLIGAWAVTMRPDPTFAKLLPAIAGTLASIGALWYLAPRTSPQPADGSDASDLERPVARRGFLQGAATVAGISLVAAALGRALRGRFDVDEERAQLDIPEPDDGVAGDGWSVGAARNRFRDRRGHALGRAQQRLLPDRHCDHRAPGAEGLVAATRPRHGRS